MTSTVDAPAADSMPPAPAPQHGDESQRPRRGRIAIIAVLIIALGLSAVMRNWAASERVRGAGNYSEGTGQSLANMNSFALALLLGGLRGPLVMILWTSSESQKTERNLEDFDTKVEWIRLLQPEFDSVHIFQVWNKAYNISVQMASLSNKYAAILDAIDYARRVEAQRPNNINMIYAIGGIYFDKLGNSAERNYYKKRVRAESLPHVPKQKVSRNDPAWRRIELDPVLDAKGYILAEFLKTKYPRPANLPADSEWNTGAELQYLEPYQPFPYGVSAMGFAYNYHKQAEVLQNVGKQKHANLSDLVVDSRPALALKGWAEDEWEFGRRMELTAFNLSIPEERSDMELPTANIALDAPFTDKADIDAAIFSYNFSARIGADALKEYDRHLKNYGTNALTYQSHMDGIRAQDELVQGDRDYLKAMEAPAGPQRQAMLESAGGHYRESIRLNQLVILKYYVDEGLAAEIFPKGVSRATIQTVPADQYGPLIARAKTILKQRGHPNDEDRAEYERYITRAQARLKRIQP
jgi:hypothetical protein